MSKALTPQLIETDRVADTEIVINGTAVEPEPEVEI